MSDLTAAGPASVRPIRHDFVFTGDARTYFAICLRTFLLAVVTFGIYDAWGTVERRRYRMGNTRVAGHGFDYHASPIVLLIGRFVAIGVIIGIQLSVTFLPPDILGYISPAFSLLVLFGMPFVVLRSLRFHVRNTSYRNIRFDFVGGYWGAFFVTIVAPFLVGITVGLIFPWYRAKYQNFIWNNVKLGRSGFSLEMPMWPLYRAFIVTAVLGVALTVGYFALAFPGSFHLASALDIGSNVQIELLLVALTLIYGLALAAVMFIFTTALRNTTGRNLKLEGGHSFDSNVRSMKLAWIVLSRGLLATVTLGLLLPWATIQIHRYLVSETALLANGELDRFVAAEVDPGGAAVSEFGAMEGIADGVFSGI
ncbi:MAG: YjgN family protein [Alphaproteobacteria bacterium]